jgi:hypothetical protein
MLVTAGVLTWLFERFDREGRLTTSSTRRAPSATPYAIFGGNVIVGTF